MVVRSSAPTFALAAFAALVGSACSDYLLAENPADGVADDDSDPGSDLPGEVSVPGSLFLESPCLDPVAGTLRVDSVGAGDLVVQEVYVDGVSNGGISVVPSLPLPATLVRGESLDLELTWTPDGWAALEAAVRIAVSDPARPVALVGVLGSVFNPGSEPYVTVQGPACATVLAGEPAGLVATVSDDDDPSQIAVRWTDSSGAVLQEGPLDPDGTSRLEAVLPEGVHAVVVTATDHCGSFGSSEAELTVTGALGTYSGPSPDGLDFDDRGYLWIADWATSNVYQVVPASREILKVVSVSGTGADGLSWMDGLMLVSLYYAREVVALDPCDGTEVYSFASPGVGPSDVSWDGSNLWVTDYLGGTIYAVDPLTGAVLSSRDAPYAYSNGLTWDGAWFWLTANGTSNRLARLEPDFSVAQEYPHAGSDPRGIAWDGSRIWHSDGTTGAIDSFVP